MWVCIDDELAVSVLPTLRQGSAEMQELATRIELYQVVGSEDGSYRRVAESHASNRYLEFDSDALVSVSDENDGAFVMAWHWITDEDAGIDRLLYRRFRLTEEKAIIPVGAHEILIFPKGSVFKAISRDEHGLYRLDWAMKPGEREPVYTFMQPAEIKECLEMPEGGVSLEDTPNERQNNL